MVAKRYDVLSPVGAHVVAEVPPTRPVRDLSGATICELWDRVFEGDRMYAIIEDELRRRFPGIRFVSYDEFGNTHQAEESAVLDRLADRLRGHGCDAVISAVGA